MDVYKDRFANNHALCLKSGMTSLTRGELKVLRIITKHECDLVTHLKRRIAAAEGILHGLRQDDMIAISPKAEEK